MGRSQSNSTDNDALLQQLRDGNAEAFHRLFARHRPYLRQMVELRLSNQVRPRMDPSDIVQEAQIEALRRLPDYLDRPTLPLRLWLRQITYDRLIMAHRRHVAADRRTTEREVALPDQSTMQLAQQLLAETRSNARSASVTPAKGSIGVSPVNQGSGFSQMVHTADPTRLSKDAQFLLQRLTRPLGHDAPTILRVLSSPQRQSESCVALHTAHQVP